MMKIVLICVFVGIWGEKKRQQYKNKLCDVAY